MKRYYSLLMLFGLLALTGCKKDPQEIFNEQKSGVVLICNEFYYDITLPDGENLYFSGIDDDGSLENLTNNREEIRQKPNVLNGTGFFIDRTGRILTNRHVVAPQVDKATVRNNINAILQGYAIYIDQLQDSLNQRYAEIQSYAEQSTYQNYDGETYSTMSDYDIATLQQEVDRLRQQYDDAQSIKNYLMSNILSDNFSIQLHSRFGIAYDGSSVDKWDDFMRTPCDLLRVSDDANSDLALLQLHTRVTPADRYIYSVEDMKATLDDDLKINQTVYMIGYNHGVALAKTDNGIRAQFTSGTITQQPDGKRITYSIPAMPGSSGSPIVDDRGRLIAVNFAGSSGSDNFNFGIPLMRILAFLK